MFGWFRLRAELGRWRQAGKRPKLWWRDDDARTPTPHLRRLLVEATRAGVPLSLSVIPDGLNSELCAVVSPYPQVTVLQHGYRHLNEGGDRPSEFPANAAPEDIAVQLAQGWAKIAGFERRLPVYVPPWNNLKPNVRAALDLSGYLAVSIWGGDSEPGRLDAHVDLLRWNPGPRFAGHDRVLGKFRRQLLRRRRQRRWDEPIGILTHHLVQDEDSWKFLSDFLQFAPLEAIADWPEASVLFGCAARPPQSDADVENEGREL